MSSRRSRRSYMAGHLHRASLVLRAVLRSSSLLVSGEFVMLIDTVRSDGPGGEVPSFAAVVLAGEASIEARARLAELKGSPGTCAATVDVVDLGSAVAAELVSDEVG